MTSLCPGHQSSTLYLLLYGQHFLTACHLTSALCLCHFGTWLYFLSLHSGSNRVVNPTPCSWISPSTPFIIHFPSSLPPVITALLHHPALISCCAANIGFPLPVCLPSNTCRCSNINTKEGCAVLCRQVFLCHLYM